MAICPFLTPTAPMVEGADRDEELRHLLRCREDDCLMWNSEYKSCNIPRLAELLSGVQLVETRSEAKIERLVGISSEHKSDMDSQLTRLNTLQKELERLQNQALEANAQAVAHSHELTEKQINGVETSAQLLRETLQKQFSDLQDVFRTQLKFLQNQTHEESSAIQSNLADIKATDAVQHAQLCEVVSRQIQGAQDSVVFQLKNLQADVAGAMGDLKTTLIAEQTRTIEVSRENTLTLERAVAQTLTQCLSEKLDRVTEHIAAQHQLIQDFIGAQSERINRLELLIEQTTSNNQQILIFLKEQAARRAAEDLRLQATIAREHNNQGVALFHKRAYEAAVAEFEEALRLQPDLADAHNNLGLALSQLGKKADAQTHFKQAIQLKPVMAEAYVNLGCLYHLDSDYNEAIRMFEEALKQEINMAVAYTNLGNAYHELDRFDEAVTAWKRAIEIDPNEAEALHNLSLYSVAEIGGKEASAIEQ